MCWLTPVTSALEREKKRMASSVYTRLLQKVNANSLSRTLKLSLASHGGKTIGLKPSSDCAISKYMYEYLKKAAPIIPVDRRYLLTRVEGQSGELTSKFKQLN